MLMRWQKYDYDICYSPGKNMDIADTLSWAFLPTLPDTPGTGYDEVNMVSFLPILPIYMFIHSSIHFFFLFFFFACCFFLSLSLSFNIFPFPFLPFLHFNVVSFQKQYKNNSHKFYKYAIYVQVIKQHSSFGVKGISWHIKYKISKLNNKLNVWSLIYAS